MIDYMFEVNEHQVRDDRCGLVMPWFTHPCLEYLKTISFKDKKILEIGAGQSTLWWRHWGIVDSWDTDLTLSIHLECNHGSPFNVTPFIYDIIIIDGAQRTECSEWMLNNIKKGWKGTVIIDNWQQPSVHVFPEYHERDWLKHEHKIFKQPGHPDWQTAIFFI